MWSIPSGERSRLLDSENEPKGRDGPRRGGLNRSLRSNGNGLFYLGTVRNGSA